MTTITANDLKTKGVSALEPILAEEREALISVRGRNRYVVMDVEMYNSLREHELEAALLESRRDFAKGKVYRESVANHMKRITR
jgi:PHD/YefM family antitoxin component YafN of YafNO toxin-antitoxin module